MPGSDDLASLFATEPVAVLRGGQGQLLQWNPDTFENQVLFRGAVLSNVSVSGGVDALSLSVGDVVMLIGFTSTDGGASSWWILGRASTPPLVDPVQISGGQLRVVREDGPGILVEGGGSIDVNDGGTIRARYDDGTPGVFFGSIIAQTVTGLDGHGLLVQDNAAGGAQDILRAFRDENGQKQVFIGQSTEGVPNPVNFFSARAEGVFLQGVGDTTETLITLGNSVQVDSGNQINLRSSADPPQVRMDAGPTALAANAFLDGTSGRIQISSSSARYKKDIRSYEPDLDTYRQIEPKRFHNATQFDDEPASKREIVGFVAEDIDGLGLTEAVIYDSEGRPDGIDTNALLAGAYELIRAQQAQIDALAARVRALESTKS